MEIWFQLIISQSHENLWGWAGSSEIYQVEATWPDLFALHLLDLCCPLVRGLTLENTALSSSEDNSLKGNWL